MHLLQWHLDDPVDAFEQWTNDIVFVFQGNRNPFADNPGWVDCLYNGNCSLGTTYCDPAVNNSTGLPAVIFADGSAEISDNDFRLVGYQLPPNQFGYFLTSQTQGFIPNPGGAQGNLCLGGKIGRFVGQLQNTGNDGEFTIQVDLASLPVWRNQPALAGETWYFQAWFNDGATSNFTDGLSVTFL